MHQRVSSGARAAASLATGAQIARGVDISEVALVHGRFRAEFMAPRAGLRDRRIALVAREAIARQRAMLCIRQGGRKGDLVALLDEADDCELEARSLLELDDVDEYPNLVTTAGKNYLLDQGLAGSSYTAAWYLGLVAAGSFSAYNAADTMSSHAGWLEAAATNDPTYSQSTRVAPSWSSAASGSKTVSAAAAFSITNASSATAKGTFLTTGSAKDGTTGTLYSAGNFSNGDRTVISGDAINVTYTASL